ncbi:hypothetical protein GCM10022247_05300 [Allokutzneria multivorans]|uniref:Uncharacterized protein n=2 Tax=Allokutzneria multivorans TaxID=1142134 RepID=A0ABP7QYI2_9PSEU
MEQELVDKKRSLGGFLTVYDCLDSSCKNGSSHLVTVVGNRREKVRVVDIRVKVLDQTEAPHGTLIVYPGEGANAIERIGIDLDDPSPRVMLIPENGGDLRPLLDVKSIDLDRGEQQGFEIIALTSNYRVKWELELTVAYGQSTKEKIRIRSDGTENGAPFDTVPANRDGNYSGGVYVRDNSTGEFPRER